MLNDVCEYSPAEHKMILAISPHWSDVIILAIICFVEDMTGPHVEALKRGLGALNSCKIYRMTKEFDKLIDF